VGKFSTDVVKVKAVKAVKDLGERLRAACKIFVAFGSEAVIFSKSYVTS